MHQTNVYQWRFYYISFKRILNGLNTKTVCKVRGLTLLLELCGGEVTVSFSKYLPWHRDKFAFMWPKRFLPLLCHFFRIPNIINKFVDLRKRCIYLPLGLLLPEFDQYLGIYTHSALLQQLSCFYIL